MVHNAHPLAEQAGYEDHPLAEREGYCTPAGDGGQGGNDAEQGTTGVDPMPSLAALFKQLLDGFRVVMNGDDEDDGPFAESILSDLEPHYDDLLDFLEFRKESKARRAAAAREMRDD